MQRTQLELWTMIRCFTGPQLYKRYRTADEPARVYEPNFFESKADSVLWAAGALKTFVTYVSPLLLPYLYRRGFFTLDASFRIGLILVFVYGGSHFVRGVGRMFNPDYLTFLSVLETARKNNTPANIRFLREFDFEMWAWPVQYAWEGSVGGEEVRRRKFLFSKLNPRASLNPLWRKIHNALCWFAGNTFAGWMMYPGHLRLYNILLQSVLLDGRTKLVETRGGKRAKLRSAGGLEVDVMFVDRRNEKEHPNGNILVVASEGNAGFYEIGCMATPLDAGYSVLGWNHPGFGGSTGTPWPRNEADSVDVVMQYAFTQLGFNESDTILFAWSIGGYAATWAAMNYPNVRGVSLDATFDDLLPLAIPRMPVSWKGLVEDTVRGYWDLRISDQLKKYQGPVQLIRRTKDEIICTDERNLESQRKTNRARDLLRELLQYRYPLIFTSDMCEGVLEELLHTYSPEERLPVLIGHGVSPDTCVQQLLGEVSSEESSLFPLAIGKDLSDTELNRMALFLADWYLTDFDSTHCNPLPASFLRAPSHPWQRPAKEE